MVVSDTVIDDSITLVSDKYHDTTIEYSNLRVLLNNLNIIKMVIVPDPTVADPTQTRLEIPTDPVLNVQMTSDRRQEIYDKCLIDIQAL